MSWFISQPSSAVFSDTGQARRRGIARRLAAAVRQAEGRYAQPSAGTIDAGTVRGADRVCGTTTGYDAGKKIPGAAGRSLT